MVKQPIRTCCVCRSKMPKYDLQRFVWKDEGVVADPDFILPGRGAYCCTKEKCLQLFLAKKKKWKRLFRL
ncbi:MAG: YlxR family protein [Desulfobulbaceae bacterium]|nr:YlxR family protein [Desulfobulbaceae bacterium]